MTAAPLTLYSEANRLRTNPRPRLLEQARRGNHRAFTEMVAPHVPALYRRARGLTGNTADAEDVRQETLLKAWSRLEQFTGSSDATVDEFRAWISRIAANSSIDLLRQRRDGKILSLEEPKGASEESLGSTIPAQEHDPEELCARREMGRLLANAILQLPRDLRQACLLRDVLHYSTQEVADRLGISIVAVRLRLFRAHRRLRDKLLAVGANANSSTRNEAPQTSGQNLYAGRFSTMSAAPSYASGD